MTKRCQMPTSEVDHDAPRIFGTTAYVACAEPAAWVVGYDEVPACERCAREALLYGGHEVADADGEPMVVS